MNHPPPPIDIGMRSDGTRLLLPGPGAGLVHLLVSGKTGSGKSGTVTAIIGNLAARPDVALYGIDHKIVEQLPWSARFTRIATDDEEADDICRHLEDTIVGRARHMAATGAAQRRTVRHWEPTMGPAIVLLIDEMASLKSGTPAAKRALAALDQIAAKGRAFAVHVIAATQKALTADFPSTFLSNFEGRLVHRMGTPLEYATALNVAQAELADHGVTPIGAEPQDRGRFYIQGVQGVPDFTLCRSAWWPDPQIDDWAARCARYRIPETDHTPAQ